MTTEVLARQAGARAKRTGESLEVALELFSKPKPDGASENCAMGSIATRGRRSGSLV